MTNDDKPVIVMSEPVKMMLGLADALNDPEARQTVIRSLEREAAKIIEGPTLHKWLR